MHVLFCCCYPRCWLAVGAPSGQSLICVQHQVTASRQHLRASLCVLAAEALLLLLALCAELLSSGLLIYIWLSLGSAVITVIYLCKHICCQVLTENKAGV